MVPAARPASGLRVRAEGGFYLGEFVGGHRDACAGPAADDPILSEAADKPLRDLLADFGPVEGLAGERADELDVMSLPLQPGHKGVGHAGPLVAANDDAHGLPGIGPGGPHELARVEPYALHDGLGAAKTLPFRLPPRRWSGGL